MNEAPEALARLPGNLKLIAFSPERTDELVRMWRASFERGVGVVDPHPLEEQRAYLEREVLPKHRVLLVLDGEGGPVVAFSAFSGETLAQLYVHVDYQGRGIGTALLELAKRASPGRLRLFTFEVNQRACRFYERHGFRVVARGFEPAWQLADVEYAWTR